MPTAETQGTTSEAVRHGSRWLHAMPTEDQVKTWFDSQHLHAGMKAEHYYGGIVVIGAKEKVNVTARRSDGQSFVREEERAVFVPYVKVDTRIAYFWDLVRTMNAEAEEEKYVGVIEPVPVKRVEKIESPFFNAHLPEGFFVYIARNGGNSETYNRYICCTQRVAIYERESYARMIAGSKALPILQGIATKQTLMAKAYADDNAMMKAETGAVGRALGMAGILVVGTGIATAEDMQEANENVPGAGASKGGPSAATLPDDAPVGNAPGDAVSAENAGPSAPKTPEEQDEAARERALALQREFEADHPEAWEAFREWWQGRNLGPLSGLTGPALKGALTKLERDLDAAKTAAQGATT